MLHGQVRVLYAAGVQSVQEDRMTSFVGPFRFDTDANRVIDAEGWSVGAYGLDDGLADLLNRASAFQEVCGGILDTRDVDTIHHLVREWLQAGKAP